MADSISQLYDLEGTSKKFPQTLMEAVLYEKDGNKTLKDILEGSGNGIPPQDMREFSAQNSGGSVTISFRISADTIIDGQRLCTPAGVLIRRSETAYPQNITDGDLVASIPVSDLDNKGYGTYTDAGLTDGTRYYYTAFPYSDHGVFNTSISGSNTALCRTQSYVCYGFRINQASTVTSPDDMVTAIPSPAYELSNAGYKDTFKPAHMDFDAGVFDYGSWSGKEFFFPRSCALGYDGVVDYYLDENDESKMESGGKSDYNNSDYSGNIMVEFGRDDKKIWVAYITDGDVTDIYIADTQIDSNFHAWAFNAGKANHFYISKYFGSNDGTRMRSISGLANKYSITAQQELDYAAANGTGWNTVTKAQWDLLGDLCVLLSGTLNSQEAFGLGHVNTGWHSKYEGLEPGSLDGKGMFWGEKTGLMGVKVFGIENPWGNLWRRIAGWMQDASGNTLIKLTLGTDDGSTATAYNITGDGYLKIAEGPSIAGYISKVKFDSRGFRYPIEASGSASTRYCDYKWTNASAVTYARVGCSWDYGLRGGVFVAALNAAPSTADFYFGSSLSYTPAA